MNISPLNNISSCINTSAKSEFQLREGDFNNSTSINSFSSHLLNPSIIISRENLLYNVRNLKNIIITNQFSQNSLLEKVGSTIDLVLKFISTDQSNDQSIADFCEFFGCCYSRNIHQDIIPKLSSLFEKLQLSSNILILIS